PHVDTILELPKGWGIAWFERPRDFVKNVWDKLKGHTAVAGGIPPSLFYQSPEKVEEYVKNILQKIKPEGGFMIAPGVAELPADVNPASVKAYINAVLKYGSY
ncbi:MAG: uroporphyrinogen decarboxylase family protein, partial [Desulfurococcaceae archaeon]